MSTKWYSATIAKVFESSGIRKDELAWHSEFIGNQTLQEIAKDAALAWYDGTDQCSEARITVRLTDRAGLHFDQDIRLAPKIAATVIGPVVQGHDPDQRAPGSRSAGG